MRIDAVGDALLYKMSDAIPRYPILRLEEVRQKLRTSGFSEEETLHPDRLKACKALPVDAVLETKLKSVVRRGWTCPMVG